MLVSTLSRALDRYPGTAATCRSPPDEKSAPWLTIGRAGHHYLSSAPSRAPSRRSPTASRWTPSHPSPRTSPASARVVSVSPLGCDPADGMIILERTGKLATRLEGPIRSRVMAQRFTDYDGPTGFFVATRPCGTRGRPAPEARSVASNRLRFAMQDTRRHRASLGCIPNTPNPRNPNKFGVSGVGGAGDG